MIMSGQSADDLLHSTQRKAAKGAQSKRAVTGESEDVSFPVALTIRMVFWAMLALTY